MSEATSQRPNNGKRTVILSTVAALALAGTFELGRSTAPTGESTSMANTLATRIDDHKPVDFLNGFILQPLKGGVGVGANRQISGPVLVPRRSGLDKNVFNPADYRLFKVFQTPHTRAVVEEFEYEPGMKVTKSETNDPAVLRGTLMPETPQELNEGIANAASLGYEIDVSDASHMKGGTLFVGQETFNYGDFNDNSMK